MILRLLDFRFQPGSTGVLLLIHGMGQDVPTHVTRFYGRALDPSVPGGNQVQSRSVRSFQPKCSEQAENPGSDRALFRKKAACNRSTGSVVSPKHAALIRGLQPPSVSRERNFHPQSLGSRTYFQRMEGARIRRSHQSIPRLGAVTRPRETVVGLYGILRSYLPSSSYTPHHPKPDSRKSETTIDNVGVYLGMVGDIPGYKFL